MSSAPRPPSPVVSLGGYDHSAVLDPRYQAASTCRTRAVGLADFECRVPANGAGASISLL
ncbi:hypothetical protein IG631_22549 [Alternaria alternata]|nr:hypothetical protein IG631_22549 [Alternaria alternata]